MALSLSPVRSKSDLNEFIRMVWPLYEGDPYWVPPVLADRRKILDRDKNPFYKHSDMEMFLARRDGRTVGRIAAIVNRRHNELYGDTVGFFGFFESIDDQEVADALLSEAERWLAARGMTAMRGPMNPSVNDEIGLLVDGFDDPPQILMTYNPKYYSRLIESFGLRKIKDLYAYRLKRERFVSEKLDRVQQRVRERYGVTIRTLKFSPKKQFEADAQNIKEIYRAAWEPNWGSVAMTEEEFDFMVTDLKQVADPEIVIFAEVRGTVVGFALGLPDINQVLIRNRGGSMLGAGLRLLTQKKRITRGRILVLGVVPEFQRRGLDSVLYYEVGTRMTVGRGYTEGEASWVLEDNVMMNRAAELMEGERYKTYRLYEKTMNKN